MKLMYVITRLEALHLRDALQSMAEEDDVDMDEVAEALVIVEGILNGQEVTVCLESES